MICFVLFLRGETVIMIVRWINVAVVEKKFIKQIYKKWSMDSMCLNKYYGIKELCIGIGELSLDWNVLPSLKCYEMCKIWRCIVVNINYKHIFIQPEIAISLSIFILLHLPRLYVMYFLLVDLLIMQYAIDNGELMHLVIECNTKFYPPQDFYFPSFLNSVDRI